MKEYKCLQECFKDQSFEIHNLCECKEDERGCTEKCKEDDRECTEKCKEDERGCTEKCITQCSEGEDYDYFGDYSLDPEQLLSCREIYQSCNCIDLKDYTKEGKSSPERMKGSNTAGSLDAKPSFTPYLIPCLGIFALGGVAFYKWRKSSKQGSSRSTSV